MNKKGFVFGILLVFIFLTPLFSAHADGVTIVFENSSFDEVYSSEGGEVRSVFYTDADSAENFSFVQAVYSGNRLTGISFENAVPLSGQGVWRSDLAKVESGDVVKAFVLSDGIIPVKKAVLPETATGILTGATFNIGDGIFNADINHITRTVAVTYPCYIASSYGADTVQGIISSKKKSMETASVSFEGKWNSISPANEYSLNLNEENFVTLTDEYGNETEYRIVGSLTCYNRVYDCENAVIETAETASNWNKAYRIGAPKYITSEANRSDGTWLLAKNSVLATSVSSENGNDFINIKKSQGEPYCLWTSGNGAEADMFSSEFDFRLNDASAGSEIMTVWSSNTDKIIITTENMPEGFFTLAHSSNDGSEKSVCNGIRLEYGKWYSLRFVFRKGDELITNQENGYVTELYINGSLADVFSHGMSQNDFEKAGSFIYKASAAEPAGSSNTLPYPSYPYIAFEASQAAGVNIDIDNLVTERNLKSNATEVYYARVTVGGKTYNADVNTLRKEITVDIPASLTADDLKSAKVTVSTRGSISPKANGSVTCDLTSPVTYTLSSADGKYKEKYTLRAELSTLMRNYDCEGASIVESSGAPSRLSSEKGKKSNWVINKKTNTSAEAADGSATIETEGTNDYIKVAKNNTTNGIYFSSCLDPSSYDRTVSPDGIFADKFAMEVDFKIEESGSSNPDYFASICSSKEDVIVFSKKNASGGKYRIASANVAGVSTLPIAESPELSFGDWHNLRYIFRRYAPIDYTNSDWYAVEIYIDGKFITELHRQDSTIKENDWKYMYSGRFNSSSTNYAQLFMSLFREFTGSISLDNFNITYIESWGGASDSVMYASDVPVALVIAEDGSKSEQLLTLNSKTKTATVYVPFTTSVEQQRNMEGRGAVKPHADVSDVVLVFPKGTNAALNGRSLGNRIPCNLNEKNHLTVNGETYELVCEFTELGIRYDANGASVAEGLLTALSGGNEASGNYGYGNIAVLGATAPADENGGNCIRLSPSANSSASYLEITQPPASKAAVSNRKIISSFELEVEGANDNSCFATVSVAGFADVSLKSSTGGKYSIASSDSVFEFGKPCNIAYVISEADGVHTADVFADSAYICTLTGSAADMNLNTAQQLDVSLDASSDAALKLDNITVQAINNVLEDKTVVHLLGDSICCYYGGNTTLRGWGQYLMTKFDSSCLTLNHAVGGYNTNIFLNGSDVEKTRTRERWSTIKSLMKPGDYLMIALAWNEANANNGTTKAQYEENIMKMVSEARDAGVVPAIVTPHLWVKDSAPHELENLRIDYVECIRDICRRNSVTCLDLNAELVKEWEGLSGNTLYSTYFYSDGLHMNSAGAKLFADKVAAQIESTGFSLSQRMN